MKNVAIILPAYNEEQTIASTIKDFHKALPKAAIWVINNRSNDKTEEIALKTLSCLGCLGGLINESRLGKGNALRRAFLDIDAKIYIIADADLTYPAATALTLITPIMKGEADMVIGDRHTSGHYAKVNNRVFHGFGNYLVRYLVNKLFSSNLTDIMSGYRAFSRSFIKSYPILVEGFEIETDMTIHALDKRFRIAEIPINYRDRPQGSYSKLNTISDGIKVLKTILNILRYYRPFLFFGSAAFLIFLLALIAGAPVIYEWIISGSILHIPLAILAASLGVIGMIFIAIAIILDTITHQDKCNFERDFLAQKIK